MSKKFVIALYLLTLAYQPQRYVDAAPYPNDEDSSAIIVIPFKATDQQVTKIKSFKIDGQTAVKQLLARVSAEKVLRTLSSVSEFDILLEGLDAITLGDVYKAAFPSGILHTISERYLRSPLSNRVDVHIAEPQAVDEIKTIGILSNDDKIEEDVGSGTEIPHDEVHEDEDEVEYVQANNEGLKEEPITDDYVYDQPVEDRFPGEREYDTRDNGNSTKNVDNEETRDSKNLNVEKSPIEVVVDEKRRKGEVTQYGAQFRHWITNLLVG